MKCPGKEYALLRVAFESHGSVANGSKAVMTRSQLSKSQSPPRDFVAQHRDGRVILYRCSKRYSDTWLAGSTRGAPQPSRLGQENLASPSLTLPSRDALRLGPHSSPASSHFTEDVVTWFRVPWLDSAANRMSHFAQVTRSYRDPFESASENREMGCVTS